MSGALGAAVQIVSEALARRWGFWTVELHCKTDITITARVKVMLIGTGPARAFHASHTWDLLEISQAKHPRIPVAIAVEDMSRKLHAEMFPDERQEHEA